MNGKNTLVLAAVYFFLIIGVPLQAQVTDVEETEQLDFAQGLLERGLYDMASAEYQKFMAAHPGSSYLQEAALAVGESYFLAKNFPKAIEAFNQFKKQYPDSAQYPSALLRLGQIYISQKNFDEALKELTSMDADARLKGQLLQSFQFYIGKIHLEKKDLVNAFEHFEKASQVTEASAYTANAYEQMAEIYISNMQYEEAIEAYRKAIQSATDESLKGYFIYKLGESCFLAGKYPEAIGQFQQILTQYPNYEVVREAVTNLLAAYFNLNQYDQVISEYQHNASFIKEEEPYFNIHLTAARALVELKKYDEALALLEKINTFSGLKDKEKRGVILTKADVLIKQKNYQEGLTLMEGALPGNAEDGDKISFMKAQACFGLGNFEKASAFFQDVNVNHASSNFAQAALLGAAHSRQEMGNYKEAAEYFLKYYQLGKDETLRSEALYDAALMSVQLNNLPSAVEHAEEYVKTFPGGIFYEPSILLLADIYNKNNQSDKAVTLLKDYLNHPERVQRLDAVNFLLGYSLQFSGQSEEALKTYAQATLNRDDPKFYVSSLKNMAGIYLSQGKEIEAAETFDRLMTDMDNNTLELKTYLWVCEVFLKDKKFKDVLRVAEKAEKQFLSDGKAETAYFKAEAYRELNDKENALKFFDIALSSDAKNMYSGSAHIGKGYCLTEAEKLDEAKAEFQKALDDNPDDSTLTLRARFELAKIADEEKNPQEALKFYLLIGTIYEDNEYVPESLFRAAKILDTLNRKDEAFKIYQEIAAEYSSSPQATLIKAKILGVK